MYGKLRGCSGVTTERLGTIEIGTVGLSTGITADLCSVSKLVIIILMFIGRLGPITVALSFGHNKKGNTSIKYPKTEIIVG